MAPHSHLWTPPLIPGQPGGPRSGGTTLPSKRSLPPVPEEDPLPPCTTSPVMPLLWAPEGLVLPAHLAAMVQARLFTGCLPCTRSCSVRMIFWTRGVHTMALRLHQPAPCFGESSFLFCFVLFCFVFCESSFIGTWSHPHRKESIQVGWELSTLTTQPWSLFKGKKIHKKILNFT